jgi:hypothetical protein
MTIHKTVAFFFVAFSLLISQTIHAQNVPVEIKTNPLYSHNKEIINGTKWIYQKKYRGIPFLAGASWVSGNVMYRKEIFEDVQLNYDLYTDEFILFVPDEANKKFVVVSKDFLQSFSFTDPTTHKNRFFEFLQLPGTKEKQLYEVAYSGNSTLLLRHKKKVSSKVADGFLGDYVTSVGFYLKTGDHYQTFKKKKDLFKILGKHIPELRQFIRKNKLKIKTKNYTDIAPVIEYFDQLEAQKNNN